MELRELNSYIFFQLLSPVTQAKKYNGLYLFTSEICFLVSKCYQTFMSHGILYNLTACWSLIQNIRLNSTSILLLL